MDYSEIEIRGELDPLAEAIDKAESMLGDFGDRVADAFRQITGVVSWDDLFSKIRSGMRAFQDSQLGVALLNKSLKDTEQTAGLTYDALEQINTQLQKISNYTEDAIRAAETALLKFKDVKGMGGIFQDTLRSAMDLAAATGKSLVDAVNVLGAALNNPRKNLEDLEDAGVSFTKSQKAMIEAMLRLGNIVGAQRLILNAVQDAYGGLGDATNDVNARLDKLSDGMSKVWKSIGGFLVPYVNRAIDVIEKFNVVVNALAKEFIDSFGPSGIEGTVDEVFGTLEKWFWKIADAGVVAFSAIQVAVQNFDAFIKWAFANVGKYAIDAFFFILDETVKWGKLLLEAAQPALEWLSGVWDQVKVAANAALTATLDYLAAWAEAAVKWFDQLVLQGKQLWTSWTRGAEAWIAAATGFIDKFVEYGKTAVNFLIDAMLGFAGLTRDMLPDIVNPFAKLGDKLDELKAKFAGFQMPKVDLGDINAKFDTLIAKLPRVNLDKLLADLKKARDDLARQADDPTIGAAFRNALDDNRKRLDAFADKVRKILDDDKYRTITGKDVPFGDFSGEKEKSEGRSSAQQMEDLLAPFKRIQEAAARRPELGELERIRQAAEEEVQIQRAMHEAMAQQRREAHGLRLPSFAMQPLVEPQWMGA
jgi:hypothetical protein